MESNSIIDIQHAILTIQEAIQGSEKYLEGYQIPERSLPSKVDLIQRELRSIVQFLNLLDHSYTPQSLDAGSRNLIVHRYVAFRAKDSVISVDCAIGHLRHDIFWTTPEMTSSVNLILKGTSISTESFSSLLNNRAVTIPDASLAGLPSVIDFYRVMQMLGSLLTDLSRMHFVQPNQNNGAATCIVRKDISAKQYCTTDQASPPDMCPGKTAWSLTGSSERPRSVSKTFSPMAYLPIPPSNAGSHDADISRFTSQFTTSISPFMNLPSQNVDSTSAHSLDLNYQFPPEGNSKILDREVQETFMPDNTMPTKTQKRSRRNRRRRQRHHRVPHTVFASEVASNIKVEDPINTGTRNAIGSLPLSLPQTPKLSNVQPVRSTQECFWNQPAPQSLRDHQPVPRYPPPATVYTISTSSQSCGLNDIGGKIEQQESSSLLNDLVYECKSISRCSHPPGDRATSANPLEAIINPSARNRRIASRDARRHNRRLKGRSPWRVAVKRQMGKRMIEEADAIDA